MRLRRPATVLLTAAVTLSLAGPAFASHFRASFSEVAYSAGTLTWHVDSAWRLGRDDQFMYGPSSVQVTDSSGALAVDAVVGEPTFEADLTDPLFDRSLETVDIDASQLLDNPDTYTAYVTSCCRVNGVTNTGGNDSFSQSMSFTVNADGSVDLPPSFIAPTLYELIPIGGRQLTVDYAATDAAPGPLTYSLVTDVDAPAYGAAAMPCSALIGSKFTLSPSLCADGEVFADAYPAGAFYAVKVRATDGVGNHTETDTLLRVPTVPQPAISDEPTVTSGTVSVSIGLADTDTVVDSYDVTCVNDDDPTDTHTATSTTTPVTVRGLSPDTAYTCEVTATNGLGSASASVNVRTLAPGIGQSIAFTAGDVALSEGTVALDAVADSGLDVTFSGSTPEVCTVKNSTATLVAEGTCTVTANQDGDATYDPAEPVEASFAVLGDAPVAGTPHVTAPTLVTSTTRIPTTCSLSTGTIAKCRVTAYAMIGGERTRVGSQAVPVAVSGTTEVFVPVSLNAKAAQRAKRLGGVRISLSATVHQVEVLGTSEAIGSTRAVAKKITLRPTYFNPGSRKISDEARSYLTRLSSRLDGVESVRCTGFAWTRTNGSHNVKRAEARAQRVCDLLVGDNHVSASTETEGIKNAVIGERKNRRVDVTVRY